MYVVLGATGNTGGATARALLKMGLKVRVVVRNAAKGDAWRAKGAEVAIADYSDVNALKKAVNGASGLFLMSPPPDRSPDPLGSARRQAEVYKELIDLVPRVVVLSSVGGHHADRTGSIRTLHIIEEVLKDTGVVFLRPGYFAENWLNVLTVVESQGVLPTFLQPLDKNVPTVTTADIGVAAAELLVAKEVPEVVELLGPQDVSPQSLAFQLSQRLGREITPVAVPPSEWSEQVKHWGLSDAAGGLIMEMYQGINSGHVEVENPKTVWRGETQIAEILVQALPRPVEV